MTPRDYISWSQLQLWEKSPELYKQKYIFGDSPPPNKYMLFGKKVAEDIERGSSEIFAIQTAINLLPEYKKHEYKMTAGLKWNGKIIKLLGIFDLYNPKKEIGEIKTGKKWTQKNADDSDQLTFYALIHYLEHKTIPRLYLHWIQTEDTNQVIETQGITRTYETKRTMADLIKLTGRIGRAWQGIEKMTEETINKML